MTRLEMKNYYMIITEKHKKISALSSRKIDKHEYLTSEIVSSDQRRVIEQAKFTDSALGKALEK